MSKVTHREQDKMRYTMKTNARRALKTRWGQVARDAHEQLIHQDEIGFYIVEKEVLQVLRDYKKAQQPEQKVPAPTAAPAASVSVLRPMVNPEIVKSCLEALEQEEEKDMKHAKAARCDFKNGARKPLKGKTAEVWAMGDKLLAELGRTPELKEMKAAMPSYNGTTVAIQFYAWRKYNGLDA
ncbi:hypothetical protein bas25_0067 [Escherichia phage VogelGryff]|nr:hypothetical protein bas25_0067 [Escherichia phage VogelGryff]